MSTLAKTMPPGLWPEVSDPRHKRFLRHWAEQRGDGIMALRSGIDPASIRDCLPHLWIYRWDAELNDFVCTLAGEAVNQAWGFSLVGLSLDRIMGPVNAPTVRERYAEVLRLPAVQCSRRPIMPQVAMEKRGTRLIVPLADAEGGHYGVLGMSLYEYDHYADADKPVHIPPEVELYPCAGLPRTPPA